MDYGDLETELVSVLTAYFTTNGLTDLFEAIPIPENEAESSRPFLKGTVSVQYYTSDYQPTQSINQTSQIETVYVRFSFQTTTLRGQNGFYKLIGHLKTCLLGYKPNNGVKRMEIDKYDLLFYENNTFQPWLQMKFDTVNAQVLNDEEQPVGTFKYLTVLDTEEGLNTQSFSSDFSPDLNTVTNAINNTFKYNPNAV